MTYPVAPKSEDWLEWRAYAKALLADHKQREDDRSRMLDPLLTSAGFAHDDEPQDVPFGKAQRWKCARCGRVSKAPVRVSYDPCPIAVALAEANA